MLWVGCAGTVVQDNISDLNLVAATKDTKNSSQMLECRLQLTLHGTTVADSAPRSRRKKFMTTQGYDRAIPKTGG